MDTYRSDDSGHTIIFTSTRDGMSGKPLPLPIANFDAKTWLESVAKSANHGCGQVYELFEERLFSSIDGMLNRLPPDQSEQMRSEAVAMFGYRDPAIIAAEAAVIREEDAALGIRTCVHHLDPDCCPLGCGDRDA
jgi:hypothetical protein